MAFTARATAFKRCMLCGDTTGNVRSYPYLSPELLYCELLLYELLLGAIVILRELKEMTSADPKRPKMHRFQRSTVRQYP